MLVIIEKLLGGSYFQMSTKDILKKIGSCVLQFWIGQLIVVVAA